MNKETRTVRYDEDLGLEAYRFRGIVQPFPNHFHGYYVIGYVEAGLRRLFCKNREYTIKPGGILLFNPRDNHGCAQSGGERFAKEEALHLFAGIHQRKRCHAGNEAARSRRSGRNGPRETRPHGNHPVSRACPES